MSDLNKSNHAVPHQMRKVFGPNIYRGMAEKLFPNGSTIRCKQCCVERKCTTQEIETWLRDGYPACRKCGKKTDLVNPYAPRLDFE
jgi:hypothetical protein